MEGFVGRVSGYILYTQFSFSLRNKIVSFKGTRRDQFSRQGILHFNNHEIILECILQPTTGIIQAKSTGHSEDKLQNMFD